MTVVKGRGRRRRRGPFASGVLGVLLLAGCGTPDLSGQAAAADRGASGAPGPVASPEGGAAQSAVKVTLEPCPASIPGSGSGGDRLPQRRLACLGEGPAVDLSAGHGRPTVVNVWASWCGPCRSEMPRLRASAAGLAPTAGFLGVDVRDDPGAAWAFLAQMQVRYPQVSDPSAALLGGLHVPGVPVTFVLDAAGVVVFRHIGELHEADISEMENAARTAR